MIDWVAQTTDIYSSQCQRLGNPRSRSWQLLGENSLLGLQMGAFLPCLHIAEGGSSGSGPTFLFFVFSFFHLFLLVGG